MTSSPMRRSVIAVFAAAAVLLGGLWAGRLAAGPAGSGRHLSAERVFSRVADRLDLSDSQRGQVLGILKAHRDAIVGEVRAVRAARHDLRSAIDAEAFDENGIRAKAAALAKAEGDAAVLRAQLRAEILPVLNDEQRQKLAAFGNRAEGSGDRLAGSIREFLSK
jgi:periplasmic protein CpxP/Spy